MSIAVKGAGKLARCTKCLTRVVQEGVRDIGVHERPVNDARAALPRVRRSSRKSDCVSAVPLFTSPTHLMQRDHGRALRRDVLGADVVGAVAHLDGPCVPVASPVDLL